MDGVDAHAAAGVVMDDMDGHGTRICRGAAVLAVVALLVAAPCAGASGSLLPGGEARTVTAAQYELSVQRNGRVDINLTDGAAVFANAYPMVWLEGDDEPKSIRFDGQFATRKPVGDRLGQGHGLLLLRENCEWLLRTYSAQPFLSVRLTYVNDKKKPVRVKALLPWCIGDRFDGRVTLGPGTPDSAILENGRTSPDGGPWADVVAGDGSSDQVLTVYNPATGRSMVAGFLTAGESVNQVALKTARPSGKKQPRDGFGFFRTACTFDPPVEVQPGDRLSSSVLYLAVAEATAHRGLERYGQALAAMNGATPEAGSAWESLFASWNAGERVAQWSTGQPAGPWGRVEMVTHAARHYYFAPAGWRPRLSVEPNTPPEPERRIAWWTAVALAGGEIDIEEVDDRDKPVVRKLLPALPGVARPLDLFSGGTPRMWSLPMASRVDDWHAVALFNWDEKEPAEITVPLTALEGFFADTYHTVFDFWNDEYYGTAKDRLTVTVPAGGVRVIGLRPFRNRPTFLGLTNHIAQGSRRVSALDWNPVRKVLSGTFEADADTDYDLRILVPAPYQVSETLVSASNVGTETDGNILKIHFHAIEKGAIQWSVQF